MPRPAGLQSKFEDSLGSLMRPCLKVKQSKEVTGISSGTGHLPSMHRAVGSVSHTRSSNQAAGLVMHKAQV